MEIMMAEDEIKLEALDLNQQGVTLLHAGNPEAAKEKFERAIELDPMLMDSYKNYGDLYMNTGDYQQAKTYYKKAILIDKRGELYFLLGNACFMADDVHEGLENYNMAISAGYDGEEMLFFMGMAYEHLNDDQMALRFFQKACIKNPSRPDFQVKKILKLLQLNMDDAAEESVENLLKISPELYDGYHFKTQLLMRKGDVEEAVEFAKSATQRFPEDADLMYDYANCLALSGNRESANKMIQQAKKLPYFEDSKRDFLILEARIATENQDVELAKECCKQCIEMEQEGQCDGEARFLMMNMHLATVDYASALEQAKILIEKKKEDSFYLAALYYCPFCMRQLGNVEESERLYKEAVSIYRLMTLKQPNLFEAYLYRAMCLKDMEEYDKGLELLEFVAGISGDVAEVHTLRASILDAMGKTAQAEEERQKSYKMKPELQDIYNQSKGDE